MIINAAITAWRQRTGSDKTGQASFEDQVLARSVLCLRNALTSHQQQTLQTDMKTADESVTYAATMRGVPAIAEGDRVQLDSEDQWAEVVKKLSVDKGAVSNRVLMVRWL